jgi:hypothetical protein
LTVSDGHPADPHIAYSTIRAGIRVIRNAFRMLHHQSRPRASPIGFKFHGPRAPGVCRPGFSISPVIRVTGLDSSDPSNPFYRQRFYEEFVTTLAAA